MNLLFFQNIVSPHQMPYIEHLPKREGVDDVVVLVPEVNLGERDALGWDARRWLKTEGVRELIDVMAAYAGAPEYGSDFAAKIYKVTESEDGERLCFIKITGGELRVRDRVTVRSARGGEREEKVSRIRLYSGSRFEQTDTAAAGTVCAVTGLGQALPGDSLGAEDPVSRCTVDPYMVYKVLPPAGMDPHRLKADLDILTAEDPVLQTRWSADGSIEMRLMGQVHLEVLQSVLNAPATTLTLRSGGFLLLREPRFVRRLSVLHSLHRRLPYGRFPCDPRYQLVIAAILQLQASPDLFPGC